MVEFLKEHEECCKKNYLREYLNMRNNNKSISQEKFQQKFLKDFLEKKIEFLEENRREIFETIPNLCEKMHLLRKYLEEFLNKNWESFQKNF